jgi:succinate dehydrogenase/fumarate reductase flavoprotein subunit
MPLAERLRTDVVVVGAGLAGMTAALAAERAGARVVIADRGPIGTGTNSALSNGAFSAPASADRADEWVELVLEIGKRLNRVSYVRRVAHDAPAAVAFLESLGLDVVRTPGQWTVRSDCTGTIPGMSLVRRVADRVAARDGIHVVRGFCVEALVEASDRVVGVRGAAMDGRDREILAPAVVLACGGAGAIYTRHDNQGTILGQGYRLAAEAGLDLWDMEFVQSYPIVLDEPGMPMMMIYPPYPAEARLVGPAGEDLLQKHGLGNINQAIIRKRDTFAATLIAEAEAGPVRMDLRAVPDDLWEVHPLSLLKRFKAECWRRPIRVSPAVHFFMGGVRTDEEGRTGRGGLFACGETVWGLHGANRMGGNALMECLVSGRLAGLGAAGWAKAHPEPRAGGPWTGQGAVTRARPVDLRGLRRRIRAIASRHAGVVRSGADMAEGQREAEEIWQILRGSRAAGPKDRLLRNDLLSAAFTLRAVLAAGIGRLESRGSFLRADHPAQDDARWLRNSRLTWDPAAERFEVDYVPATAT